MSVKLTSYINFKGNAGEAIEFYKRIFNASIDADTFGEFNESSGGAMTVPEEDNDKIMHASLTGEHVEFMISDYPSSWENTPSESNIVLSLSGDDDTVLRSYWDQLSVGGTIVQPLEAAPWGDTFGSVTDKFGVSWMVDISPAEQ